MGLYSGGLIIGRSFASEIWGAYFREGLFLGEGGLIIGILRYLGGRISGRAFIRDLRYTQTQSIARHLDLTLGQPIRYT